MKRQIVLCCIIFCGFSTYAQQSLIGLEAGYIIDIDRTNEQVGPGSGWRIIGTYQETLKNEKWAIGLSAGLMEDQYEYNYGFPSENLEFIHRSVPIYVSGKYFVGKKDWRGYVRGSGGINMIINSSSYYDETPGFYAGVGLGLDYHINDKWLINSEYEFIACDQGQFYGGRLLHSFNIGIGYKF